MMLSKKLIKYDIRNIFIFSLSNIGDMVLTCPVVDGLLDRFPTAQISIAIGPKAKSLFEDNPYVKEVYVFDKHQSFSKMHQWVGQLKQEKFDMVIDLRHTAIRLFLPSRYRTPFFEKKEKNIHMRLKHFKHLKHVVSDAEFSSNRYAIFLNESQKNKAQKLLEETIGRNARYVVMAAGSANPAKRWTQEGFTYVAASIGQENNAKIVFVGDESDKAFTDAIMRNLKVPCVNLCGKTTLLDLAYILQKSLFAIVNDSAVLHLASYFDVPVLGLFGPSDPVKYGPWSKRSYLLQSKEVDEKGQPLMSGIDPKDVLDIVQGAL